MAPTERVRRVLLPILLMFLLAVPVSAKECVHEYEQHMIEPNCDSMGYSYSQCRLCGHMTDFVNIPELGHDFAEWYVYQEPTCTSEGIRARDCVRCGYQAREPIEHLGHEYVVEVMPPSCTARGYTSHYCPTCGDRFRTDYTPALGHRYDYGVIVTEPTEKTLGWMRYRCIGCGDTYQDKIPYLTNPFCDLTEGAYYETPVLWASVTGITAGVDDTHFGPDRPCTRAQVVTFLWRRAGKPTPASSHNPFEDVPPGSFYEQAVLWAYETGITAGTDATHFSPDAVCNRAQVVTFLHRFRGCPEPILTVAFSDVPDGAFFQKAVLWATQKEITQGMGGGKFCPEQSCTRAQIVTFLYRDAKTA